MKNMLKKLLFSRKDRDRDRDIREIADKVTTRRAGQWLDREISSRLHLAGLCLGAAIAAAAFLCAWVAVRYFGMPLFFSSFWGYFIFAIFCALCVWGSVRAMRGIGNYQMGYWGELLVAQAIGDVGRKEGWAVIHDFQLPKGGNIDHVIVSPKGLFCVETKTPFKSSVEGDVVYDGVKVKVGNVYLCKPDPVKQAKFIQEKMSDIIRQDDSFDNIRVKMILAFPERYVHFGKSKNPSIFAMRETQIKKFAENGRDIISVDKSEELIRYLAKFKR